MKKIYVFLRLCFLLKPLGFSVLVLSSVPPCSLCENYGLTFSLFLLSRKQLVNSLTRQLVNFKIKLSTYAIQES